MFLQLQELFRVQQTVTIITQRISQLLVLIFVVVVAGMATSYLPRLAMSLSEKSSQKMKQQAILSQKLLSGLSQVLMEYVMVLKMEVCVVDIGTRILFLIPHLPILLMCSHLREYRVILLLVVVSAEQQTKYTILLRILRASDSLRRHMVLQ